MSKANWRTSTKERISFVFFMIGAGLINTFSGSYMQVFFTNFGIAATSVATVFIIGRVWDAVNDPLFGALIDRLHLKGGRLLPWLRAAVFLTPLTFLLIFAMPQDIPVGAKIAWALVSYLFYDIAYTMGDVPIFSMTSAMTDQVQERVSIMSRANVFGTLFMLAIIIVAPILYPSIGWLPTAAIIAVISFVMVFPFPRIAKERFVNKDEEKVTLKMMGWYIKNNKYLVIYFVGLIVMNITMTVNTMGPYFAEHCLGSPQMAGTVMAFLAVPALVLAILMPTLTKRFDKFHILMFCAVANAVVSVAQYFIGYQNMTLFYAVFLLRGVFYGAVLIVQIMFTGDIVEYGEFKTGKRLQGTAYSLQTFTFKFFNAVAASFGMFLLGKFGFVEGMNVVQTEGVKQAIWALFTFVPAIGVFISLPLMLRYKLRDKDVQLMAAVNSGEMERAEAEKQFSHPY